MALAMAMALQELATNAVKHGALSNPEGEVRVHWELKREENGYYLHIKWEESGVPSMFRELPKRGFGTRLIERTVKQELGGNVRFQFAPTGLVCELNVPLEEGSRRTAL